MFAEAVELRKGVILAFTVRGMSRLSLLAFAFGLVGVTGCTAFAVSARYTVAKLNEATAGSRRAEVSERANQRREADRLAAANGDASAMVRSATHYIPISTGLPEVVALLEQASQKQFAPAQFMLGGLLLTGKSIFLIGRASDSELPRQPGRGIELMKRAASQACDVQWSLLETNTPHRLAFEISHTLQAGEGIGRSIGESQLWLARSVVHCHYPDVFATLRELDNLHQGNTLSPIEKMAWSMLYGTKDAQSQKLLTYLKARASAADIKLAEQRSEQLRSIVAESEKDYAPPAKLVVTVYPGPESTVPNS